MAFFDEELRNLSKRTVPASVSECLKQDKLSQALWQWAQNLENYGRIILIVLVICGCIITIWTGMSTYSGLRYDDSRGMATFLAVAVTALQWAFFAFLEYCVYHALSLLMGALASIVQSNKITSDLALYHASLENGNGSEVTGGHFTVEALGELAKKKAQGMISEAEYEAKRAEIMKNL